MEVELVSMVDKELKKETVTSPIVKVIKSKKGIPTVIEFEGRRYIYDHPDTYRGG